MEDEEKSVSRNSLMELIKIGIENNTIICLPTGSGKPFIATMVLKHLSAPLLRPYSGGGKIAVILVNSAPSIDQRTKYVRDHTTFNVGTYTEEMNLDIWRREKWEEQFNEFQVIVMTSQILLNLVNENFIDLERINLLIFDECHRGVDNQSMLQLMKTMQSIEQKPRILGFTTTLLIGNCKLSKVREEVKNLEVTYNSKVATVEGLDAVLGYSTNPQEYFEICEPSIPSMTEMKVISHLRGIVKTLRTFKIEDEHDNIHVLPCNLTPLKPTDILKSLTNLMEDLIIHIKVFGSFGGHIACVSHMIQIERIKKHCEHHQLFIMLNHILTMMEMASLFLEKSMAGYEPKEKLWSFSSDKVLKLFSVFDDYSNKSKEELRCLVFTNRRFTAKIIHHIIQKLKETDPKFGYLKSNFIVGNRVTPNYKDTRELLYISKKNREVLNSFINKELNVLVSTSILEEDVDLPICTLVVKFDKSECYRSYIHSKGRARNNKSLYCTILEVSEEQKFAEKYNNFQRIEDFLNKILISKNSERDPLSESVISETNNEDNLEPYFVNGPNSAEVNMNSSVALLYRYCSSFQIDQYSFYFPEWYLEKNPDNGKVRMVIFLPTVSPILEPITGPFMSDKEDAKKAAALVACKKLHLCGELDDNLLPFKKDLNDADIACLFQHWPKKDGCESGNKKKEAYFDKEIPLCIKGQIQAENPLYLHVIKLNPLYERNEDYTTGIIYDLYKTPLKFGLLSPKPLPDLCKFPLFDSKGIIEIEIKPNIKALTFTADELTEMRRFHFLIFNDLLEILQRFLVFDNSGINSEILLVVPVQEHDDVEVDFKVIRENKSLKSKSQPTFEERTNLEVTEENYLGKIISPWYRADQTMYLVTGVCTDKTPLSPFPNENFTNFVNFYSEKHSQTILDPNQPLLQSKRLSDQLNTFKPSSRNTKEKMFEDLEELLVPELVVKQEFPSSLWIQARFLPSLLSRVTYLLKLQALQMQIARDIGVNEKYLQNCPSLQIDKHLRNYKPQADTTSFIESCLSLEDPKDLMQPPYNKDFAAKLLEAEYYWSNIEEPIDVEREIDVTVIDIEYYEIFISDQSPKNHRLIKNDSLEKHSNLSTITHNNEFKEKHLILLEMQSDIQSPNLCHFYQALTLPEANDIVNFKHFKTLGNSFLKLSSSLYIFFKFPTCSKGEATTLKNKLISNKNLFYLAANKNLGGILKNSEQCPDMEWVPPCFCVPQAVSTGIKTQEYSIMPLYQCSIPKEEQISGNLTKKTLNEMKSEEIVADEESLQAGMCHFLNRQYVEDKTMADCVKALLGAYLLSGGIQSGIKCSEWFGIVSISEHVKNPISTTQVDPIFNRNSKESIEDFIPQWQQFEQILGYQFNNRAFLLQALTHPTYLRNRLTQSYERLEFLGDGILDFLITCYIYEHCEALYPSHLSDLHAALVNNIIFASLVVRCGFHKFLLMTNSNIQKQIDKFEDYLKVKNYVIDDEILILLEEDEINIAEYVDLPKVLGDIFKALAGAIYLDSNKDLKTVWKVFYKIMWHEINLFSENVPKNVIRRLYECDGVYPQFSNAFDVENKKTMVSLDFMCDNRVTRVYGFGPNEVVAKRVAAKLALRTLNV